VALAVPRRLAKRRGEGDESGRSDVSKITRNDHAEEVLAIKLVVVCLEFGTNDQDDQRLRN
jgi:hypothetical protein